MGFTFQKKAAPVDIPTTCKRHLQCLVSQGCIIDVGIEIFLPSMIPCHSTNFKAYAKWHTTYYVLYIYIYIYIRDGYWWRVNWRTRIRHSLQWRHNERNSVSNHQPHDCLLNRLFRRRSEKISKLRVTGLCAGNSPGTGVFPAQMASNVENVSISWRHHGNCIQLKLSNTVSSWIVVHHHSGTYYVLNLLFLRKCRTFSFIIIRHFRHKHHMIYMLHEKYRVLWWP